MEWWQALIAFWLSGVFIAMWKVWRPSINIIRHLDPHNPMSQNPITATCIIFILFTIFLPFLVFVILFDDDAFRFTEHFLKGAMSKDDK
tara:strand:- start:337 stop:603 length:267 start_codon:yes stop_codon:yes gene_type:complete